MVKNIISRFMLNAGQVMVVGKDGVMAPAYQVKPRHWTTYRYVRREHAKMQYRTQGVPPSDTNSSSMR